MVELKTGITLKFPSNNLSKYSLFIDGSSLIDSIKPLLAFVSQTCCGAFRNTTNLTAVKQGYAYTFTANRVHTNVIKVIATVVYEKSTEVYEYDLTKSSWSPISIFATKDDLGVTEYNAGKSISISGKLSDIGAWLQTNGTTSRWMSVRANPTNTDGYFGQSTFCILWQCSSANYGWCILMSDNTKMVVLGRNSGGWHWYAPSLTEVS